MQSAFASWFHQFGRGSGLQVFEHVGRIVAQIWKEKARAAGKRMNPTELMTRA
jgi:hypothetical protein